MVSPTTPTPRRVSLARNCSRPRCRRIWTVPRGQPRLSAASDLGLSLHVTEYDRPPVFLGQAIDLLVQFGVVHGFESRFRGLASA